MASRIPKISTVPDLPEIPEPVPVHMPNYRPPNPEDSLSKDDLRSVAEVLQEVKFPQYLESRHLEHLGIRVIDDAPIQDIIPDSSYDPLTGGHQLADARLKRMWHSYSPTEIPDDKYKDYPKASMDQYSKFVEQLSTPNSVAFAVVRGEECAIGGSYLGKKQTSVLGYCLDFFADLERVSMFWDDTSNHAEASRRILNGHMMTATQRKHLLESLVKIVGIAFRCRTCGDVAPVDWSRHSTSPRLCINRHRKLPNSQERYWALEMSSVYRVPSDQSMHKATVVEGPIAALSCRGFSRRFVPGIASFDLPDDARLDFAAETACILACAQLRARKNLPASLDTPDHRPTPNPTSKITKNRGKGAGKGYRCQTGAKKLRELNCTPGELVRTHGCSGDAKVKFQAFGKIEAADYDDIFMLSSVNHHVCCIRSRVPRLLLAQLDGKDGLREEFTMYRSRWWDMFIPEDRVEALRCIWAMMSYQLRGNTP